MTSERVQRRIDRLLDQAEAAADQRDWNAVAESARMVLSVEPDNADARSFLTVVAEPGASVVVPDTSGTAESEIEGGHPPPAADIPSSFAGVDTRSDGS